MPRSRRRFLECLVGSGLPLLAGCLGGVEPPRQPESTTQPLGFASNTHTSPREPKTGPKRTRTSLPNGAVEFPDGPKERPDRPDELTRETVGEYVEAHEYRYVYNTLWYNEHSAVSLSCEVESVERPEDWYRVIVSCTGYSNTGGASKPNSTETSATLHADYFTQVFTYLVDEHSIIRRRATEAEKGG